MPSPIENIQSHPGPDSQELSDMDKHCLGEALKEAQTGLKENGIPIGSVLYHHPTKTIISRGHNQRVQKGSMTLHAEMDCYEKLGRPSKEQGGLKVLRECTLYTTLSPCIMCSATSTLYRIPRVVMGENVNFRGGEDLLKQNGTIVINADDPECKQMMGDWIKKGGGNGVWWEDIGELEA